MRTTIVASLIGVSMALIITLFFFSPIMAVLTTPIVAIGLDPLTTRLITALLFMVYAALISAMLSRQRLRTTIGAGIVYSFSYVLPFFHQELLPHYDLGGRLEVLNAGVLAHTICVLFASGLLCAYLGAAMGSALGENLLDPIWKLVHRLWRARFGSRWARSQPTTGQKVGQSNSWKLFSVWVSFFMLLVIIILSTGISDLLFFSPNVGVYSLPATAPHGTLIADSMSSLAFHGQRRSFLVYLPPSYMDTTMPKRRYPTLYLLHGSPGSEYDWIRGGNAVQSADTLIGSGKIPDLIMVFPDGNGRGGETSEWGNSFDQKQLMENFVALDLVHFIDQKYLTIPTPDHRTIGGFSMGGFGAMNIAVHHPDIFGSVIALAGYYMAEGSIWGQDRAYMQANSPILVLPIDHKSWKLHIFLGAATEDQPYYSNSQRFILEMKVLHMDYTFDLEHGFHTWRVWEMQLYHGLQWMGSRL